VRRRGHSPHDAQDLTQGFFARLITKDGVAEVHPDKGRFRCFLLAAMKHFLSDARDHANAQKRGGGYPALSLDDSVAEDRYRQEPQDNLTPDRIFDRRWAYTLIETVVARLREEFVRSGKGALFDALRPFLVGDAEDLSYAQVASHIGMSAAAAKMTVTRMRRRYGQLLRLEVANTVANASEIDEELRHLFAALQ
jgi:RNA polymerase sigma-70 factor (ECF subfamily)